MSPDPTLLLAQIIATLRLRYKFLNQHFEAGWTESWSHRRCLHEHLTLIEAAKCAMPHGAGWYVFAVEGGRAATINRPGRRRGERVSVRGHQTVGLSALVTAAN